MDLGVPARHDVHVPTIPLTVLPDESDDVALQAWVDVAADGVPLRMLVDTGTTRTAVPHVEPFASRTISPGPGGRGVFGATATDPLIDLNTLQAGDLVTNSLLVERQPELWVHPPLLGMDVLGSHACLFDFADRTLHLDAEPQVTSGWLPLTTEPHRTPTVEVIWAAATLTAVWDTGAGITIVDRAWATAHPEIVTISDAKGVGTDSTGATTDNPQGRMASCRIGGLEFPEQLCGVVDLSALNSGKRSAVQMIIGLPLMVHATWFLDFPRHRWTVHH